MSKGKGCIISISHSRVVVADLKESRVGDAVCIGDKGALGIIKEVNCNKTVVNMLEPTDGVRASDRVDPLGHPFFVELGPGLLGNIFNGLQAPIGRTDVASSSLDHEKRYPFNANNSLHFGDLVCLGSICGAVLENGVLIHRVLVPKGCDGALVELRSGKFNLTDRIGKVKLDDGTIVNLRLSQNCDPTLSRVSHSNFANAKAVSDVKIAYQTPHEIEKGKSTGVFFKNRYSKNWLTKGLLPNSRFDVAVILSFEGLGDIMRIKNDLDSTMLAGNPISDRCVFMAEDTICTAERAIMSVKSAASIAEYYRDMGYDAVLILIGAEKPTYEMHDNCDWMCEILERSGEIKCSDMGKKQGSLSILVTSENENGGFAESVMRYSDTVLYAE